MMGTLQPASRRSFFISGTAAAASGTLTVQRTISEPASASSSVCFSVASISAVSVLVIDCTAIGAPPPTCTLPTFTPYVFRRAWHAPLSSKPAICVREAIPLSLTNPRFGRVAGGVMWCLAHAGAVLDLPLIFVCVEVPLGLRNQAVASHRPFLEPADSHVPSRAARTGVVAV